jgi:hypothetical protein
MDTITITLTKDEAELVMRILKIAPLQGTVETLPTLLSRVVEIMKKLDQAGEHDN